MTRSRPQGGRPSGAHLPNGRMVGIADLVGTFVFAPEGALTAIRGNLDFFGVMVLSFVTAVGGGIIRDVLLGATPPSALHDWRYGTIAFAAGAATFALYWRATAVPTGSSSAWMQRAWPCSPSPAPRRR